MGLLGFEVWSWFGNASASGARVGVVQRLILLSAHVEGFPDSAM